MQNIRSHLALAGALLGLTISTTAVAQFTGPGARAPASLPLARTVAEALQDPADDRPVELTGTLVRQTGRETFVFTDATGEITVEIDADDFPASQPVAANVTVHITGEVEARWMRKPTIDVDALRVQVAQASVTPAAP